jgi:hypothetical protein
MPDPQLPTGSIVTLVKNPDHPSQPWQIVDANNSRLQAFSVQGDAVSWLLGQGYRWVPDTQTPQQWRKESND